MAAATNHMSERVLSMDITALRRCHSVVDDRGGRKDDESGGHLRRRATGGDCGDQGLAPGDRPLHRSSGMYTRGTPPVMVRPSTTPTTVGMSTEYGGSRGAQTLSRRRLPLRPRARGPRQLWGSPRPPGWTPVMLTVCGAVDP